MVCDPLASGLALPVLEASCWPEIVSLEFLPGPVGLRTLPCVLQVELGQRPTVERAPPVTEEEWNRHVGPEGRLQHVPELKNRIFSGVSVSGCRLAWMADGTG